jgi:acetyl-CoA decarbonylase/synthase complex subunit gamma
MDQPFVAGSTETPVGPVPRVSGGFSSSARLGAFNVRWGIGRMHYTVDPGLYAIGDARPESPVFATANYKLTFDLLRRALAGKAGWILVLDTRGINVWCAAGKGTFGTDEIVERVEASGLADIVSHRRLIVPQLGAPGVTAHEVRRRSGFQVIFGPVRADDLPAFLENGLKATGRMRTKDFPLVERLALIPMEVVPAIKWAVVAVAALYVLSFLASGFSISKAAGWTVVAAVSLGVSILAGAALVPALLPWLPGRAFSVKGFSTGLLFGMGVFLLDGAVHRPQTVAALAQLISIPALSAFFAMNFTGSSTYTSLSGVQKEMRLALPLEIGGMGAGFALWVIAVVIGG